MAPRRGGGGFSSSYYGDDNPWSETIWLSLENLPDKDYFLAQFAFDILSLIAFIIFLIWTCTIRNRSLPLKGIICALTCFICSQINIIVTDSLYIAEEEVKMYYVIDYMLQGFFLVMGNCITFYVFWSLIHRFLGLLTSSSKPHVAVTIIHYLLFALIFVVSLAQTALYIAYWVGIVTDNYDLLMLHYSELTAAIHIIYWLLSMEVIGWTIFVIKKAGSHHFVSKMPASALVNAAFCWFAGCLTWAVIYIHYSLMSASYYPIYLNLVTSIIQFIFWVGTYTGILLCCAKWHRLGDEQSYAAPQYEAQYPPAHIPQQNMTHVPEGQYPSVQQQPYGSAPYQDYSAQPHTYSHQISPH
ncbi:PDZ-binding protein CRIPT [Penicillium concentricum]|uniref:PDZ-binding protein CRIPT n=1 Tax=Penicillium concentricum TaxID=293559 RepID=A0A9W9RCM9_9EURO|nr:PDZ-binding protein CRIPT [Penicillium concentricum]KAJ5356849.1 PDZ-binding protein CRIPT [Penicillium concentricum]